MPAIKLTHRCSRVAVCLFVASLCAGAAPEAASDAVAKAEQLVKDGQHNEALKFISEQLAGGRRDDKSGERYQLLMLRGESMLQTGTPSLAISAFDQAGRAAPDGRAAALARANVLVIKASPQNAYKPKNSPGGEPIDIVNPDSRKAAYDALREDMTKSLKPKLTRASQAKTLNPALELLPNVFDLASLEYASTGAAEQTRADAAQLGKHSRGMMEAEIRQCGRRIESLEDLANSSVGERRGLYTNEQKDLKEMILEMRRIEKAAREVRRRVTELGFPEPAAWEPIAADAADVADAGETLLEYGSGSTRAR